MFLIDNVLAGHHFGIPVGPFLKVEPSINFVHQGGPGEVGFEVVTDSLSRQQWGGRKKPNPKTPNALDVSGFPDFPRESPSRFGGGRLLVVNQESMRRSGRLVWHTTMRKEHTQTFRWISLIKESLTQPKFPNKRSATTYRR